MRSLIPARPQRSPQDGKIESVIVMLNGLAETDISTYDDLAGSLADHGIASIMLPLPNHFCRLAAGYEGEHPYEDDDQDPFRLRSGTGDRPDVAVGRSMLDRLANEPGLWIDGFEQALVDVCQLLDCIRGGVEDSPSYFRDHFSSRTRVSLYGYSLGGLIALCCVLARWWLIRSAFIVNSGSSLEEVDASSLFKKRDWKRIQLGILASYQERIRTNRAIQFNDEFEQVMLGNWARLRQERLKRLCRRILFIAGANDEIFNVETILRLGSRDTGIAFVQLPQIGHMIASSSRAEWDRWRRFLAPLMQAFEANHPADSLLEEAIELPLVRLHELAPGENIRAKFMRLEGETLVPDTVSPNTVGALDAKLTLPHGKGLCWEAMAYGEGEMARADFADAATLRRLNYTADEERMLAGAGVRCVVAAPVFEAHDEGASAERRGVVAFASNRGPDESVLDDAGGIALVRACAKVVGQVLKDARQPRP